MILPVVLYRVPDELFPRVMAKVQQLGKELNTYLRVEMQTDRLQDAAKAVTETDGILLLITHVESLQETESLRALQLGRLALSKNRDRYVIYCAEDNRTMISMAPYCTRPAAIVTDTILEAQAPRIFRGIFNDYSTLHTETDEGNWISVKEKAAFRRINLNDVCVIMAANKMLEIHLLKETIVTYDSLENFSHRLDERFVRCHRSSIINTKLIQSIDFQTMMIFMMNGMQIPLARSFKHEAHALMDQTEAKKEGEA